MVIRPYSVLADTLVACIMEADKEILEETPESSTNSQSEMILDNHQDDASTNASAFDDDASRAKSPSEMNTDNQSRMSDKSQCSNTMDEDAASPDDTNACNSSTTEDCAMEFSTDSIAAGDDLRQFDVLDDLERHMDQNCSGMDSDTNESMDSDVPDEEIEAMLEEGKFRIGG